MLRKLNLPIQRLLGKCRPLVNYKWLAIEEEEMKRENQSGVQRGQPGKGERKTGKGQ